MTNTLNVARNEFANLLNSKFVWLITGIYLFFVAHEITILHPPGDSQYTMTLMVVNALHPNSDSAYYTFVLLISLVHILMFYGGFFGLVLGVFTIGSERYGNTLNTLIVKPLYRDTIINGKLLGSLLFIVAVFILTILIYTLFVLLTWKDSFFPIAGGFLIRVPIILVFALVYVLVYYALSLLISLVIRDIAFALIVSFCISVIIDYLPTTLIQGHLNTVLGLSNNAINFYDWTPGNIIYSVYGEPSSVNTILSISMDLMKALSEALPVVAKVVLYLIILVFASYIIFVRSDIS